MYFVFDNDAGTSKDLQSTFNLDDNELFLNINENQRIMLSPERETELNAYYENISDMVNVEFFEKIITTSCFPQIVGSRYHHHKLALIPVRESLPYAEQHGQHTPKNVRSSKIYIGGNHILAFFVLGD